MARIFVACAAAASATTPATGTYEHAFISATDEGLEELSGIKTRDYQIAYPSNSQSGDKFPLIVFAHGAAGGGVDTLAYEKHLGDLASYGFVVIFPKSCFMGCSPPKDLGATSPDFCYQAWPSFVHENTRAIEWARNQTDGPMASLVDWDAGAGVAGHSMGGEVVSQLASSEFASKYNVKAAVCEHCLMCIKTGDLISTPAMFMTGTLDYEVTPKKVKAAYQSDVSVPKSYRNQKGKGHLEMLNLEVQYNSAVASHAAAFFNVWLKGDQDVFYNQVYGDGDDSFCGYGNMKECEHVMSPAASSQLV
jgi:dienelactone hydrolase